MRVALVRLVRQWWVDAVLLGVIAALAVGVLKVGEAARQIMPAPFPDLYAQGIIYEDTSGGLHCSAWDVRTDEIQRDDGLRSADIVGWRGGFPVQDDEIVVAVVIVHGCTELIDAARSSELSTELREEAVISMDQWKGGPVTHEALALAQPVVEEFVAEHLGRPDVAQVLRAGGVRVTRLDLAVAYNKLLAAFEVAGALVVCWFGCRVFVIYRGRERIASGQCPACSFDLRATVYPRCPECGLTFSDTAWQRMRAGRVGAPTPAALETDDRIVAQAGGSSSGGRGSPVSS